MFIVVVKFILLLKWANVEKKVHYEEYISQCDLLLQYSSNKLLHRNICIDSNAVIEGSEEISLVLKRI